MSAKVSRFEDVIAWQKARTLTARVYQETGRGEFHKDYGLKDQVRRAAVSVMSNIAEGFERGKPSEFHQFLSVAKGSCAELRAQLYVALDAGYLSREVFDELMSAAVEVGRITGGLRAAVERKRDSA
jgi:four helix bundle protein